MTDEILSDPARQMLGRYYWHLTWSCLVASIPGTLIWASSANVLSTAVVGLICTGAWIAYACKATFKFNVKGWGAFGIGLGAWFTAKLIANVIGAAVVGA